MLIDLNKMCTTWVRIALYTNMHQTVFVTYIVYGVAFTCSLQLNMLKYIMESILIAWLYLLQNHEVLACMNSRSEKVTHSLVELQKVTKFESTAKPTQICGNCLLLRHTIYGFYFIFIVK